jgi:hypothetical protein
MVKQQQRNVIIVAGLALVLLVIVYVQFFRGGGSASAPEAVSAASGGPRDTLPRIGLDRLSGRTADSGLGKRDIFDYYNPPPPPPPTLSPSQIAEAAAPPPQPVVTAPTPPPAPPLSVRYIGSLDSKGLKVAFFLTDQKEVLSGQAGQMVMNRFRVVRIGIESVDVQDMAAGNQVRRIPLRGGS